MRGVLLAQILAAALLVCGCPGTEQTDPTGGSQGAGNSGQGGEGNASGQGGAGNNGQGGSGNSGQGGAGNNGQGGSGNNGQGGAGNSGQGGSGNSGQGGAGNSGQGGSGNGGQGGSSSVVCESINNELDVLYVDAQKCNPNSDVPQCKDVIDGPCCPILVALKDTPAVVAYLQKLKEYQLEGCNQGCPPEPCPPMPTGTCTPTGANTGVCAIIP